MHSKEQYSAVKRLEKSSRTDEGKIILALTERIMKLEDRLEKLEKK